ncbi:MAG TPA: methyltransferase [Gammaproteobacteria bacterium]
MTEEEFPGNDPSLHGQFFQMIVGHMACRAIYVVAKLGVADLLASGSKTAEEIAEQTGTDSESLYRLLRALASSGIFQEGKDRRFSLTPMAEYLCEDSPGSLRSFALMVGNTSYAIWGELMHAVQTGEEAFQRVFGVSMFEYFKQNPDKGRDFDAAMESMHRREVEPMLSAYDFSDCETVVDVGGGNGSLMSEVIDRYPNIRGIVYDLPQVIERAKKKIRGDNVAEKLTFESGSFFDSVPGGGDIYLLRHIIHDWDDEKAKTILQNCRKAKKRNARILVVENVIPGGNDPYFGKWLDVGMLLIGGKERTEEQYRVLFDSAGLELTRVIPTFANISVVEGI